MTTMLWGILLVAVFIIVPGWIILTIRLWGRCPRCRKFGTVQVVEAKLRKKGLDPDRPPDPVVSEEEESSLDLSLDIYDLFCRYRCKQCYFQWEEKPPPGLRLRSIDSP